jgi:acetyl esterase
MRRTFPSFAQIRKAVGAFVIDGFFEHGARLARLHPSSDPAKHGVEVLRDVAYAPTGESVHLLDVYRPRERPSACPVVLYVHGGGFRILSKDSHWMMALAFARRGYVVFVVNYRLAPHRFPAALEDCSEAYAWVVANAERFGGDPSRVVLAGESAGANLVTGLTISATFERSEPFARRVFEVGVVPRATLAACGIFQVSDTARLVRGRKVSAVIVDRLEEVEQAYLPRDASVPLDLADPLLVLEGPASPARPLPPFFLPCGTNDPLVEDTKRLGRALAARGVQARVRLYEGEVHAFHALMWRKAAKACWRDTHSFLEGVLAADENDAAGATTAT